MHRIISSSKKSFWADCISSRRSSMPWELVALHVDGRLVSIDGTRVRFSFTWCPRLMRVEVSPKDKSIRTWKNIRRLVAVQVNAFSFNERLFVSFCVVAYIQTVRTLQHERQTIQVIGFSLFHYDSRMNWEWSFVVSSLPLSRVSTRRCVRCKGSIRTRPIWTMKGLAASCLNSIWIWDSSTTSYSIPCPEVCSELWTRIQIANFIADVWRSFDRFLTTRSVRALESW